MIWFTLNKRLVFTFKGCFFKKIFLYTGENPAKAKFFVSDFKLKNKIIHVLLLFKIQEVMCISNLDKFTFITL